jgi:hypothetical protein
MQEEIDTCMRLLGVTRIDQLGPEYVLLCQCMLTIVEYECFGPYDIQSPRLHGAILSIRQSEIVVI